MLTDEGETYYFNDDLDESVWDPPLLGGPAPVFASQVSIDVPLE